MPNIIIERPKKITTRLVRPDGGGDQVLDLDFNVAVLFAEVPNLSQEISYLLILDFIF